MFYIALSVICSVSVSILLRFFPAWRVDVRQAIAANYLMALTLCTLLLKPQPQQLFQQANTDTWLVLLALGVLLPSIFFALARSVDVVGIVRSDAAQRLSLIIPLIAAFTLFDEALSASKLLGLMLGLFAISFIVMRPDARKTSQSIRHYLWPLLVFIGFGAIDVLFKQMAQINHIPFTTVLSGTFFAALLFISLYLAVQFVRQQALWQLRNLLAGLLLGILNFSNIYSYLLAHRQLNQEPALVFSSMNIGVIALATLIGLIAFKERLSLFNFVGLFLAILSVVILTLSRF